MTRDARLFRSLPESPELWRLFLRHMPACVAVLDRDMRYLAVSDRWYEDLELTGRDVIGQSHYDVFPDLDETRRDRHRRCLAGETINLDSDDYVLPSGARLTVKWEYVPWRDARGEIGGMVMFSEALTRQRMLEEQVEAEADRLHRAEIVGKSGAWEWDVANNVVTWSRGLSILLGLEHERATGDRPSWAQLVHPDDRDAVMAQVGRALKGEIPYDIEMRMRREDGTVIDVRVIAEISRDADGNPLSVFGAMQDISELKRAERALQDSERSLLAAQQLAHLGSWTWDGVSEDVICSPMMRALYGFPATPGPVRMVDIAARNHPDDRDWVAGRVEDLLSGRVPFIRAEFRVVPPSGETVWLQVHTERVSDASGRFIGLRGAVQDVTARKVAEHELMLKDTAMDTALMPMSISDKDGRYRYVNSAFCELAGMPVEDLLGTVSADFLSDKDAAEPIMRALAETGRWAGDASVVIADGSLREVHAVANVIPGLDPAEPLVVTSYLDITARNAALRDLARTERMLRRAQAMARMGETSYDVATGRYSMPAHTREVLGVGDEYASFDAAMGRKLIHPDDWKAIDDGARLLIKGRMDVSETSYRFLSPTRGLLHVHTVNYIDRDESGAVIGMSGIIQDVTHIKQAESEARAARRRAERYLDIAGAIIIALDNEGRITLINRRGRELLGYSEADLIGRDWFALAVPAELHDELHAGIRRMIEARGEGYRTRESEVVTRSGERRLIEWTTSLLFDDEGEIAGWLSSGRDLTDLRQAEQSLRDSEERTRAVMEAASVGIVTLDQDGRMVSLNPEAESIFGVDESVLAGRDLADMFVPSERETCAAMRLPAVDDGEAKAGLGLLCEFTVPRADREPTPVEMSVTAMDIGGRRAYVAAIQDITERKRAEAKLQQVQRLETIGQLTGGVAHDFNNLLMAMQVNLELLKEMVEHDPEGTDYADAALASVARGAELTRRLLAFSRRQPLQPKVLEINVLVIDTVRILQRTLGEQIAIESVLEPDVWPVEIDRAQLENVLMNLAVNARDAMPLGGRITIETVNTELDEHYAVTHGEVEPGDYVMLAVTDTGMGMTPQVLARAFEPFFTTKDVGRGSGLGLSMTYGFVKQSGGHVKLYSEPGEGTTIKIYLPRERRGVQADRARAAEPAARTGDEKILLIEDDPGVRQTVTHLLRSLGYSVVVASDGPEAIQLVQDGFKPHLLLADIVLPKGMTGRQVSDAISERLPGVKTLFMSGYTENAMIHHGRLDEGVVLLSKPFPRGQLAEKLREVLDS